MTSAPQSGPERSDRIVDQSADWICRIQSGQIDPDDCDDLKSWLAADPHHAATFRRMLDVFTVTDALRRPARRAAPARTAGDHPLRWLVSAAAGTLVVLALVLSTLFTGDTVRTAVGERRLVHLEDGSDVHLNVLSDVTVRMTGSRRTVEVKEGEVLFDVDGADPRPFVVETALMEVVVTGTSFQVTRFESGSAVSVLEGTVNVRMLDSGANQAGTGGTISLRAGEGIRLEAGEIRHLSDIDPRRAAGWRDGWLYLDNVSVGELVERLNRQYRGEVHTDDAALADTRISVALRLQKRNKTFERLEMLLPLDIEELPGERFVVHSSP
jgi:transmembrane sensor